MVSVSMRAAMALAVVSVSTAAFGQVLQVGAAGQFGTPYATVGTGGVATWESYRKQESLTALEITGANVAGNGTQFKLSNVAAGPGFGAGLALLGYTTASTPSSGLVYLKDIIVTPSPSGGYDVNGHGHFDLRVGFLESAAGYVARGIPPVPGDNTAGIDPFFANRGTDGVYLHMGAGNKGATVLGEPGSNWTASINNGVYSFNATSGQENELTPGATTQTLINAGTAPVDAGTAYVGGLELSTKMFADTAIPGNVILQVKAGNNLFTNSFNPNAAVFAGGFDWANATPMFFIGKGGWDNNNGTATNGVTVTSNMGIMSAGDANVDGIVDLADLSILASNWQGLDKTFSAGDFSQDGIVNLADLSILAGQWQNNVNGLSFAQALQSFPELTAVPEPASLGLVTLGAAALLRRRRA